MKYTDQELVMAFSSSPVGMKRWQVCFTPRGRTLSDHEFDTITYFSAPNRQEANQIAAEYGLRINNSLVRWLYRAK